MIFSQLIVLINCCAVYNICYKRLKNKQPPKIRWLSSSPDGAVCLSSFSAAASPPQKKASSDSRIKLLKKFATIILLPDFNSFFWFFVQFVSFFYIKRLIPSLGVYQWTKCSVITWRMRIYFYLAYSSFFGLFGSPNGCPT